eukprot:7935239-Heterocapsa_arctica.AAC.1
MSGFWTKQTRVPETPKALTVQTLGREAGRTLPETTRPTRCKERTENSVCAGAPQGSDAMSGGNAFPPAPP